MTQIWIVSILENRPYKDVKNLWKLLEKKYDSTEVQIFKHPHITFQGGKTENPRQLCKDFQKIIPKIKPFEIEVKTLLHFDKKAICLKVEKTKVLFELSQLINKFLKNHCEDLLECYIPKRWIPHITLAAGDLTEVNFRKAWTDLNPKKIGFKQKLHNLCLVRQYPDGKIKIAKRYRL